MEKYIIVGLILNFCVNFMLLLAASRLTGFSCGVLSAVLGAAVSVLYGAACTVPRFWFLEGRLWYMVSILIASLTAFGIERSTVRRGLAYCLLRLALDGLADGTDDYFDLIWAGCLSLVCLFGFRGGIWRHYVPVMLCYGQQAVNLTALHDTGNTLRDPITGRSVLVVGADVAKTLTGLTKQQLSEPLVTIGKIPGMRLIPYKTVESTGRFMLALPIKNARIGDRREDTLVAFAPEELDGKGMYQALIGGTV